MLCSSESFSDGAIVSRVWVLRFKIFIVTTFRNFGVTNYSSSGGLDK